MSNLIKTLNKIHDSKTVELKAEKLELAIRDKFIKKLKAVKNPPEKFLKQINSLKADINKGINEVGNIRDEAQKIYSGLKSLGLSDEAGDMLFAVNDAKNDFDELVYIKQTLDKL
jgi:hypothetical protein